MSTRHDMRDIGNQNGKDVGYSAKAVPTILIVDDEKYLLDLACRVVTRLGYVALAASGAQEGLRLYREHAGDIAAVLLDVNMPEMDGLEVLEKLKEITPDLRVVLWSGCSRKGTTELAEHPLAAAFIAKPFSVSDLANILKTVLADRI